MYTNLELKKYYDTYYSNQRKIKKLIRNKEILTANGQKEYNKIKESNKKIKKILSEHNIKLA